MANRVTTLDMPAINEVLEMGSGWVLDFSDHTFAMFLAEHGIDIDRDFPNGSKAKRLRAFLCSVEPNVASRILTALLVHRGKREGDDGSPHLVKYRAVIARLG